jgi:Holliday junction resolvase-like predicted endonuclease
MFVVRVENDEATLYRAFRHWQTARSWAAERNVEDVDCLVDILEVAGSDDPKLAVAMARKGDVRTVARGEALAVPLPAVAAASDIHFGAVAAV